MNPDTLDAAIRECQAALAAQPHKVRLAAALPLPRRCFVPPPPEYWWQHKVSAALSAAVLITEIAVIVTAMWK